MIRLFIYLLVITGLAAAITLFLGLEGSIDARAAGYAINVPVDIALIFVLIALCLFGSLVWLLSYLMRLPDKLNARRVAGQRNRGMIALTRGLEAVAAGDPEDARRHARIAQRQLDEPALTRLLTAQAAQLAGDEQTAEQSFSAMLDAPETEFLGLRGLYLQALAAGDAKAAKGFADRAFKLRPNARWAFESVYQLSIERGAWGEAKEALQMASRNGLAEGEHVKRKEAALLTARAYAAANAGDNEEALRDVRAALKQAAGFSPAATLACHLEAVKGNMSRAARILEQAWMASPHPAIVKSYKNLYKDESLSKKAERLMRLAAKAPERDESQLLKAQQHILLEEWESARSLLEPLLQRNPTARAFTAMAETMRGLHGEEQARPWFAKAAAAPLEPVPGADGEFHFTTDGWRRLIVEYGDHDRLAPPPLEEISGALSGEEIRLLTAPPPASEPEPEPEQQIEEAREETLNEDMEGLQVVTETETPEKLQDDSDHEAAARLPPDAIVTGLPKEPTRT